jgi:3-hydroxyacyl-[acyl-carrier-protein] dehydratase
MNEKLSDADALAEIKSYLPHRPPFLFADRVEIERSPGGASEGDRIIGYRTFKPDEFFFQGHFPGYPVVPGVILLETMFQLGGVGVRKMGIAGAGTFFLAKIKEARFRRQVRPGETFRAEIVNLKASPHIVHQKGIGFVGDEIAVEAEWISMAGDGDVTASGGKDGTK